jgi:hypothetical protein
LISRWDSAAIVPNTSELLPEPETPVNTVSRRLGSSTLTSLRLFTRAPCTRIKSWLSAACDRSRGVTGRRVTPGFRVPRNPGDGCYAVAVSRSAVARTPARFLCVRS